MKETTHTPGPWRVGGRKNGFASIDGGERSRVWREFAKVAIGVEVGSEVAVEGNANLNLILTAPELLEALIYLYNKMDEADRAMMLANAEHLYEYDKRKEIGDIIKKATKLP